MVGVLSRQTVTSPCRSMICGDLFLGVTISLAKFSFGIQSTVDQNIMHFNTMKLYNLLLSDFKGGGHSHIFLSWIIRSAYDIVCRQRLYKVITVERIFDIFHNLYQIS